MRPTAYGLLALSLSVLAVDVSAQSPGEKLVYTSLPPCRIVDTRLSVDGALTPGVVRTFHVVGSTSNFVDQGGTAGGCGIPGFAGGAPQVRAVVVNLVAVGAQGLGNLRAWASDQSMPNTSVINYAQVGGLNIANAVVVPVRQDQEGNDLSVRASVSGVHLVADVMGYFYPMAAGELKMIRGGVSSTGAAFSGEGYTSTRLALGQYQITFNSSFKPFPAVLATAFAGTPAVTHVVGSATTFALVNVVDLTGAPVDQAFWFIVIGMP